MIGLILLVVFIKISVHYNHPLVLAGAYTVVAALASATFEVDAAVLAVSAVITFWLMWLFFWLLDRYEDSGTWWALVIIFPAVMLILSSLR